MPTALFAFLSSVCENLYVTLIKGCASPDQGEACTAAPSAPTKTVSGRLMAGVQYPPPLKKNMIGRLFQKLIQFNGTQFIDLGKMRGRLGRARQNPLS